MINNPEKIFGYLERQAVAVDLEEETLDRMGESLRDKYKDMKQIIIYGKKYYTLPTGKDMGKSEKIPLISEESFERAIEAKTNLKPDALLKLPKSGVATQVQNEGMALGISCALGLTTASATMICFQDKPALFVPFDDMQPLTEFAAGDISIVRDENRTDYEDSSLNSLGPGLSANGFVNDFGSAFALMYLTGDPDGIGGYNQNKGLQNRNLYVFDHAICGHDSSFTSNYFQIDSRLRQTPKTLTSFSRHTKGRNFSLIEDASIEEKFESLNPQKCERILNYISTVISGMIKKSHSVPPHLKKQHLSLIASAKNARALITTRINAYKKMLPQAINNPDRETIKQALVLENILNYPRMYSVTGRPYRSLFAEREHSLKIVSIEAIAASNDVKIKFNKPLDTETLQLLSHRLGRNNIKYDPKSKSIKINKYLLTNLENIFYPEKATKIHHGTNYIDALGTRSLSNSYNAKQNYCVLIVEHYKKKQRGAPNDEEKISNIKKARARLSDPRYTSNYDKGFNAHMTRRFEFEAQKELQKIIAKNISLLSKSATESEAQVDSESRTEVYTSLHEDSSAKSSQQIASAVDLRKKSLDANEQVSEALLDIQNQAFSTAVQLDCIQEFNTSCIHAAENIHNPEMQKKIKLLFVKYANLNLSNCTIRDAQQRRSEILNDISEILSFNARLEERSTTQARFKKITADIREVEKLQHQVTAPKENTPTEMLQSVSRKSQ